MGLSTPFYKNILVTETTVATPSMMSLWGPYTLQRSVKDLSKLSVRSQKKKNKKKILILDREIETYF